MHDGSPAASLRPPTCPPPRCFLLNEIEKEEKEKLWYYSQLQGLSKRLDELPHVETVSRRGGGAVGGRGPRARARPHRGPPAPPSSSRCRWT